MSLPVGQFEGKIAGTCLEPSRRDPDNVAIVLELVVTDGEHAGEEIRHHMWTSEAAIGNTNEKLRELGWTGQNPETELGEIVGKKVTFATREDQYQGQRTVKVWWVSAAKVAPLSGEKARTVGAKLAGRFAELKNKPPQPKRPAPTTPDSGSDNVPF